MTYEVETIGNVFDSPRCACRKPVTTMSGLDDLMLLFPPLWAVWLAKDLVVNKFQGKPSGLNEIAEKLGVNPIGFVIGATGYTGIGEYWPAAKVAGIAIAAAGGAYVAARAVMKRKRKKNVR